MTEFRRIPFSSTDISEQEIEEVCATLRLGWFTTCGRTKEFEKRIALYCQTRRAVALNFATATEELNLRILGIGEGDEVIAV